MPASADDFEMSLDGITTLPEWAEEYDIDPIEERNTREHRSTPMKRMLIVLMLVLAATPALAQGIFLDPPPPPLSASERKIADYMSTAVAAATVGLAEWQAARSSDPKGNLLKFNVKEGITVGIATAVKKLVNRTRPDGSDNQSFFSEHTAITATAICSISDKKIGIGATILVGAGRILSWKHFLTDTLTGGLIGSVVGCL